MSVWVQFTVYIQRTLRSEGEARLKESLVGLRCITSLPVVRPIVYTGIGIYVLSIGICPAMWWPC